MSLDKRAFNPCGKTIKVAGATVAPSGVATVQDASESVQYRIMNDGAVTAFVAFGVDASTAQSNAVIPTGSGSNSKYSLPLPAGAIEVMSAPINSFWSAITASSTADIYITPGKGI